MSFPLDWTDAQRKLYGRVYRFMSINQSAHCHPAMPRVCDAHWETLSHNSAWLAAELLEAERLTIVDVDTGEVVATSDKGTLQ